ncbi:response regulator [Pantoea sp. M_9]|uniref:response regulator n=1 Tax=Pantoea sp. M_9 TaxID=2608041 RepID=UPI001231923C|nr:response regulator [Pantoea sp. M_9]KAA5971608.1 response regulator [Pantoea sp. M_9]
MANILIIDDHPVARLAVKMLLEKEGYQIIGEADEGYEALRLIRELQPDMIIVDLDIPGLNGIEVIQKLRTGGFSGGILVLTARDDEHYLNRCKQSGADGFIGKKNNLEELGDAVRTVLRGYSYFPIARRDALHSKLPADEQTALQYLSNRELQVLQYLARGQKILDIAQKMHISNKTVSTYKTRIMTKLKLNTTLDIVDFARRNNLD